jgi:hypothetical protein
MVTIEVGHVSSVSHLSVNDCLPPLPPPQRDRMIGEVHLEV